MIEILQSVFWFLVYLTGNVFLIFALLMLLLFVLVLGEGIASELKEKVVRK